MKNIQNIIVKTTDTIKETLQIIDTQALRIAVVIDDEKKVIGTICDGDIRRAILKGFDVNEPIEDVYFRTPTICNINEPIEKIIQIAISKKVYQIPIIDDNGHLVKIEDLGNMLSLTNRPNEVILMAGGLGTRLRPLTQNTPKPLLKVGNQPILETIINNFSKYGFKNITISVNYKSEMIMNYFGDGSKFDVNISYVHEDDRLGTAGALSLLKNKPNQPFFVMNADLLTNVNFVHLLDYHIVENTNATMCVREYDFQVPYGVIEVDNQQITSIIEKPLHKFFVNAGIYVLSPKVLDNIPHNTFYDMPTLFDELIKGNQKVLSFPIHEYWLDIGRISDFEQAQTEYDDVFETK
ncbi:MAG: nucleotidyltransferase family protein [Arcobacteraceae bacterium]|nr:nucleotidyltransferase family protein [Arcobacteraceae bacterium]